MVLSSVHLRMHYCWYFFLLPLPLLIAIDARPLLIPYYRFHWLLVARLSIHSDCVLVLSIFDSQRNPQCCDCPVLISVQIVHLQQVIVLMQSCLNGG